MNINENLAEINDYSPIDAEKKQETKEYKHIDIENNEIFLNTIIKIGEIIKEQYKEYDE